jgi:hypothetical protein
MSALCTSIRNGGVTIHAVQIGTEIAKLRVARQARAAPVEDKKKARRSAGLFDVVLSRLAIRRPA